jgi:ABC-type multidrug transport system fused ATPase/permease subunit
VSSAFSPPFAGRAVLLATIGVLISALAFAENFSLSHMMSAGSDPPPDWFPFATRGMVVAWLCIFVVARVVDSALNLLNELVLTDLLARTRIAIERQILAELSVRSTEFFRRHPIAEIMNRLATDVGRAALIRHDKLRMLVSAAILSGNLGYFLWQDPGLGALLAAIALAGALVIRQVFPTIRQADRAHLDSDDKVKRLIGDVVTINDVVKVFGLTDKCLTSFDCRASERLRFALRVGWFKALTFFLKAKTVTLAFVVGVAVSLTTSSDPGHVAGQIAVLVWAIPHVLEETALIVQLAMQIQNSYNCVDRLAEYMVHEDGAQPAAALEYEAGMEPLLSVSALGFAYGEAPPLLNGVQFKLEAGEIAVLFGPSGGGKTTLAALLLGLLNATEGRITVSDQAKTKGGSLFAYMPQHSHLIDGTIFDNLLFGRSEVPLAGSGASLSEDDRTILTAIGLRALCEAKALKEARTNRREPTADGGDPDALFLSGLRFEVGAGGERLSGGQRQLVSLGRTLLATRPIMILDEPTSSLDASSRERVLSHLAASRHGRVTLIISHDPQVAAIAQRVFAIRGGRVVEESCP